MAQAGLRPRSPAEPEEYANTVVGDGAGREVRDLFGRKHRIPAASVRYWDEPLDAAIDLQKSYGGTMKSYKTVIGKSPSKEERRRMKDRLRTEDSMSRSRTVGLEGSYDGGMERGQSIERPMSQHSMGLSTERSGDVSYLETGSDNARPSTSGAQSREESRPMSRGSTPGGRDHSNMALRRSNTMQARQIPNPYPNPNWTYRPVTSQGEVTAGQPHSEAFLEEEEDAYEDTYEDDFEESQKRDPDPELNSKSNPSPNPNPNPNLDDPDPNPNWMTSRNHHRIQR